MMDYIYSLSGMVSLSSVPRQEIRDILKNNTTDNREYGWMEM